jgi:hypothetical protein
LWKVRGEEGNHILQRKTDSAINTDNIKQNNGQNRILFTANAYVGKSNIASAQLSVRSTKKSLTQNALEDMTQSDLRNFAKVMMGKIERSLKSVSKEATIKLVKIDKQVINGKMCISTESEQESNGNKIRQIVDVYPLGDRILRMTVSYNQSDAKTYKPIADRIIHSLTIAR